ncbi:MAG: sugar kinase [Pseudotabrizicola sp.]|uniref:sugar kinase n=1 Tax=Pseudotabrizicola sp. TaxID=2939647 RepID=UPI00272F8726|nr:sugar kinase [Pseudotabrizicola sp.]MDP2080819.1 sugar kinase [Pseudotabrizicola sp.]MDZ7574268.1 sugar kinase [Pseudotabrizicola sp.]
MLDFNSLNTVSVGEAMVELAPVGEGQYKRGFAGDTFNTAWHMAQALHGRASVGFATRVGMDKFSDAFVAELAADDLDVSVITRDPQRNMGLYLIELDGVERSFHYWRGTSAARGLAADGSALAQAFAGAGLIHLSGITLAILPPADRETLFAALANARANGARVSFDPNIRPRLWPSMDAVRQTIPQVLALTDIALPSFDDEVALWGDTSPEATLARFATAGVAEVAVKNGAGPVSVLADGQIGALPTPEVKGIRDTTGAGDGFNAGYLSARLLGQTPQMAIIAGQRFSAEVITHLGARLPKARVPSLP